MPWARGAGPLRPTSSVSSARLHALDQHKLVDASLTRGEQQLLLSSFCSEANEVLGDAPRQLDASSLTGWSRAPASALLHIARAGSTGGGRGMHY